MTAATSSNNIGDTLPEYVRRKHAGAEVARMLRNGQYRNDHIRIKQDLRPSLLGSNTHVRLKKLLPINVSALIDEAGRFTSPEILIKQKTSSTQLGKYRWQDMRYDLELGAAVVGQGMVAVMAPVPVPVPEPFQECPICLEDFPAGTNPAMPCCVGQHICSDCKQSLLGEHRLSRSRVVWIICPICRKRSQYRSTASLLLGSA